MTTAAPWSRACSTFPLASISSAWANASSTCACSSMSIVIRTSRPGTGSVRPTIPCSPSTRSIFPLVPRSPLAERFEPAAADLVVGQVLAQLVRLLGVGVQVVVVDVRDAAHQVARDLGKGVGAVGARPQDQARVALDVLAQVDLRLGVDRVDDDVGLGLLGDHHRELVQRLFRLAPVDQPFLPERLRLGLVALRRLLVAAVPDEPAAHLDPLDDRLPGVLDLLDRRCATAASRGHIRSMSARTALASSSTIARRLDLGALVYSSPARRGAARRPGRSPSSRPAGRSGRGNRRTRPRRPRPSR